MKNGDYNLIIASEDYPGKLYRNRYCSEHVYIYWKTYGIIPKDDEVIHHKDGNKLNNNPNNLELMKRIDHVELHKKEGRQLVELKCPICNKNFVRQKNKTFLINANEYSFCSRSCLGKYHALKSEIRLDNPNNYLIKEFIGNPEDFGLKR